MLRYAPQMLTYLEMPSLVLLTTTDPEFKGWPLLLIDNLIHRDGER